MENKYNAITKDGHLVSPNQWFDEIDNFCNGYTIVKISYKKYIVYPNGKFLEITFDNIQELLNAKIKPKNIFQYVDSYFFDGYACVRLNDKWNWISKDNRLVSPNQWFDNIGRFDSSYNYTNAWIGIERTKCIVDIYGNVIEITFGNVQELLDYGYDPTYIFDDVAFIYTNYARVRLYGEWNWINKYENRLIVPDQWFDRVRLSEVTFCEKAWIGDTEYLVNMNGQVYDYKTSEPIKVPVKI